ncbi:hypothetical protein J2T58_001713 [Methanocalculus alkaliphilus]|nr:hypothetical protein [Methanocalculus alkaliphilus]
MLVDSDFMLFLSCRLVHTCFHPCLKSVIMLVDSYFGLFLSCRLVHTCFHSCLKSVCMLVESNTFCCRTLDQIRQDIDSSPNF